jgi:hypothetical protein
MTFNITNTEAYMNGKKDGKKETLVRVREAIEGLKNRERMGIAVYTNITIFEKELGIEEK